MTCPICGDIDNFIEQEKSNKEFHLPGYNYCGPGTRVVTRITQGSRPINELDKGCQIHDVEYMVYNDNDELLTASDKRLRNTAKKYGGVSGWLVNNTFRGKSFLERIGLFRPSSFAKYLTSSNPQIQKKVGEYLYKKISNYIS